MVAVFSLVGLLNLFKRKTKPSYTFTDEDRELASEVRKERAALKIKELELDKMALDLEMAQIQAELQQIPGNDGMPDPDQLLMMLLSGRLNLSPLQNGSSPPEPPEQPAGKELSDDEIRAMIARFSKSQQKIAAKLPEESLRIHAVKMFPGFSQKTYDRAIEILKGN